jgi:transposase-like protein
VTAQVRRLRRALEERRAALALVADADRRTAEATARLVELGEPVSRVAARVGLPAAALRKTLRAHQLSQFADGAAGEPGKPADDVSTGVHEDV